MTIPKDIRRVLRAREGDVLVFEADERDVVLRVAQPVDVFAEYEGAWREGEEKTSEEINGWLRGLCGHDE